MLVVIGGAPMTTPGDTPLLKCDERIFSKGSALIVLGYFEVFSPEEIDALISPLNDPPRLEFDWYYRGGLPLLLYIGKREEARERFLAHLPRINAAIMSKYEALAKDGGDDLHSYYADKLRYKTVPQIDASEVAPEVYIPRNSKDPSVNP